LADNATLSASITCVYLATLYIAIKSTNVYLESNVKHYVMKFIDYLLWKN